MRPTPSIGYLIHKSFSHHATVLRTISNGNKSRNTSFGEISFLLKNVNKNLLQFLKLYKINDLQGNFYKSLSNQISAGFVLCVIACKINHLLRAFFFKGGRGVSTFSNIMLAGDIHLHSSSDSLLTGNDAY